MFLLLLTQYWWSWVLFSSPDSSLTVMFMFAWIKCSFSDCAFKQLFLSVFGKQLWSAKYPEIYLTHAQSCWDEWGIQQSALWMKRGPVFSVAVPVLGSGLVWYTLPLNLKGSSKYLCMSLLQKDFKYKNNNHEYEQKIRKILYHFNLLIIQTETSVERSNYLYYSKLINLWPLLISPLESSISSISWPHTQTFHFEFSIRVL